MFKPCPTCGFLVALIAGREASQRCPRCGSALLEEGEAPPPAPDAPAAAPRAVAARRGDAPAESPPLEPATTSHPMDALPAAHVGAGDATPVAAARPADATDAGMPAVPADDAAAADATAATDAAAIAPGPAADLPSTPSFMAWHPRTARVRRPGRRWPWAVALPLLALLLGLQLLLSQRAELAQDARWRPWVAAACSVLRCDVPAWREPRAFAMLARNVRPHATHAGVLHVTTSLRNDARWPQPLPVVVLSLSDVDGRVLAARAVTPADYAGRVPGLVAPGDSVDIAFDVREPSPRVVSFDFQLR